MQPFNSLTVVSFTKYLIALQYGAYILYYYCGGRRCDGSGAAAGSPYT